MTELEKNLTVEERILLFEKQKRFNEEIIENLPSKPLNPNKVDYLNKKLTSKINTIFANFLAVKYFDKQIKNGVFKIKEVVGIENLQKLKGGCIITCNHFSIYDHYAVYKSVKSYIKGKLYKIIREGNFTSFKGLYGYLFRHCNTLPLSSNFNTMKLFLEAVSSLLKKGRTILIFPEQTMWKDYTKPRPLENGAFNLAVKNDVPIVPCFISTEDKTIKGKTSKFYTLNFGAPLFANKNLTLKQNEKLLKEKNYEIWKEMYEDFYKIPLVYGE